MMLFLFLLLGAVYPYTPLAMTCPNPSGSTVDWWIMYQQKSMPFFHWYIDSSDNSKITQHYPELSDSVLATAMKSIIDSYTYHMAYSSDIVNIKKIAADIQFPTPLKWMHGIIATDKSSSSGMWILHNNLYFPPIRHTNFVAPGDNLWYNTVVGDTFDNVFYVCISLDTAKNVKDALDNILSGNPFVLKSNLEHSKYGNRFLRPIFSPSATFVLEESALTFTECLNASHSQAYMKCIFRFSSKGNNPIRVFTRTRGTLKRSRGLCYNGNSINTQDFASLTLAHTEVSRLDQMNTIFALSDDHTSAAYGTTCFGQDIAAYSEIVTIMICVELPTLYSDLVKATKMTNFLCPNNKREKYDPSLQSVRAYSVFSDASISDSTNIESVSDQDDEEDETTSCSSSSCDDQDEDEKWRNPVHKSDKLSGIYGRLTRDSFHGVQFGTREENEKEITTDSKKQTQAIAVDFERDFEEYISNADSSILALFVDKSCRYCQRVKEIFHVMSIDYDVSVVTFLIVDVNHPSLPFDLIVPYTPFVRFKYKDLDFWYDYKNGEYKMLPILEFLHSQLKGNSIDLNWNTEFLESSEGNNEEGGFAIRRKRTVSSSKIKEFSNDAVAKQQGRRKRSVAMSFVNKHITDYNSIAGRGKIPNKDDVNTTTYILFHAHRKPQWKQLVKNKLKKFKQTFLVADYPNTLKDNIDKVMTTAIKLKVDYESRLATYRNAPRETCAWYNFWTRISNYLRQWWEGSTIRQMLDKIQCENITVVQISRHNEYYECTFNLEDFRMNDLIIVNYVWNNNVPTCTYATKGSVSLGAGRLIDNPSDFEVNHLSGASLIGETPCNT